MSFEAQAEKEVMGKDYKAKDKFSYKKRDPDLFLPYGWRMLCAYGWKNETKFQWMRFGPESGRCLIDVTG